MVSVSVLLPVLAAPAPLLDAPPVLLLPHAYAYVALRSLSMSLVVYVDANADMPFPFPLSFSCACAALPNVGANGRTRRGCLVWVHARNDSDQVPTSSASARRASGPTSLPLPHLRPPVRLPPVSTRILARPACHPRPSQPIPVPGPRFCTSSIHRRLVLALLRKYALSPSYRTYPHAIPLPQCSPCLGPGPSLPPVPRASVPAPAPRTTRYRIVPAAAYYV